MSDPTSNTTRIARENFARHEALTGLGRDWDDLSDEDRDRWMDAGACAICDEPLQRDEVFISTLDGHWFCSLPCRNKFWELNREERMKDV